MISCQVWEPCSIEPTNPSLQILAKPNDIWFQVLYCRRSETKDSVDILRKVKVRRQRGQKGEWGVRRDCGGHRRHLANSLNNLTQETPGSWQTLSLTWRDTERGKTFNLAVTAKLWFAFNDINYQLSSPGEVKCLIWDSQCQVLGSGVTWARGCGLFNVVDQIVRLSQE